MKRGVLTPKKRPTRKEFWIYCTVPCQQRKIKCGIIIAQTQHLKHLHCTAYLWQYVMGPSLSLCQVLYTWGCWYLVTIAEATYPFLLYIDVIDINQQLCEDQWSDVNGSVNCFLTEGLWPKYEGLTCSDCLRNMWIEMMEKYNFLLATALF